jgi:protein-tyrosine-phosphatase
VVCMEGEHRAAVLGLAPDTRSKIRLIGSRAIVDPAGGTVDEYRHVREQIARALAELVG